MRNEKFFFKKDTITDPVFSYDVVVVITNNFAKASEKLNLPDAPKNCEAATFNSEGPESTIFLEPNADPGTIAHEVWHAIRHMLVEHAGAGLDNEVVAYNLGYYVRHAHDILKKAKRKVK